jgi:SAM-dependent methyltransferase
MVLAAQQRCSPSGHANCSFHVQDCTGFSEESSAKYLNGSWDKVFSNAALHWILCKPETRDDVIRAVHSALKPGGTFVFEMGGFGNCGEVYAALLAALIADGVSPAEATQRSPWFFPSEEWMQNSLEEVGFEVVKMESENRPTRLNASDDEGKGGLEGWIKLMAAQLLEAVRDKERAVRLVVDILQSIITKLDGTQWFGYVRLRGIARKRV